MSPNYEKYLVRKPNFEAVRGVRNRQSPTMTFLSNSLVPSANCYLEFGWIQGIPAPNPFEAEHVHGFDQIMLLIGGNPEAPEELGGRVEMLVGGQRLTAATSCALFVPAGTPHGPVIWRKVERPHIQMNILFGGGNLEEFQGRPASYRQDDPLTLRTEKPDFEKFLVRKPLYERARGVKHRQSPTMTFMSAAQVPEANYYLEYGWIYGIPDPNPPVPKHKHETDEIILHFGGDWQNPEALGGEIQIGVDTEALVVDSSAALFAPRGLTHGPVTWRKWTSPHVEMAITVGAGSR